MPSKKTCEFIETSKTAFKDERFVFFGKTIAILSEDIFSTTDAIPKNLKELNVAFLFNSGFAILYDWKIPPKFASIEKTSVFSIFTTESVPLLYILKLIVSLSVFPYTIKYATYLLALATNSTFETPLISPFTKAATLSSEEVNVVPFTFKNVVNVMLYW